MLVKRVAKYEVASETGPTVVSVPQPETLFPRGLLHSSVVAYILVQKFGLGVPHYRLEQHIADQDVSLGRGMMSRYTEEAGGALGASIVHAIWQDAIATAAVISTDATGAMIQPEKRQDGQRQSCEKGHFFTAVVDCDHVLFAYSKHHTQEAVRNSICCTQPAFSLARMPSTVSTRRSSSVAAFDEVVHKVFVDSSLTSAFE